MKRLVQLLALLTCIGVLGGIAVRPVSGQQAAGKLIVFADTALFAGPNQPRNCYAMNRFKPGEPAGFRVSVIDPATGQPAANTTVVVHVSYGGKTEDVPARYRGPKEAGGGGGGPIIPNMWSAKWMIPNDAPTGVVKVSVTAMDKNGRMGTWEPWPNAATQVTIVNE
jgi:hypothetical protein